MGGVVEDTQHTGECTVARVKRGVVRHRRHKKVLKLTKGHRGTRSTLFRRANESLLKALAHAYRHRRQRKGEMRRLWILRIGAAARQHGMSYSTFIRGLNLANIDLDRKVLADLAVKDPDVFSSIVERVQQHSNAEKSSG